MSDESYKLSAFPRVVLLLVSFCLVAFGEPAWIWWFGLLASIGGFACFWRVLLSIPEKKKRFWLATLWFGAVQAVHFSWTLSHPYLYIYSILFLSCLLMGAQFGIAALWITPAVFKRFSSLMALAALWTLMEWVRLFAFSGLPLGTVGLKLTGSIYPLQLASIGGIYFLTYWIMLTNLLGLKAWLEKNSRNWGAFAALAALPYLFGWAHLAWHDKELAKQPASNLSVLLVQPAFPIEESLPFNSQKDYTQFVFEEWQQILTLAAPHYQQGPIDLILFPEYVVPFGTYELAFAHDQVEKAFERSFGSAALKDLAPKIPPFADQITLGKRQIWYADNAFIVQSLANLFQSHVVVGLEDSLYEGNKRLESYSAGFHFLPGNHPPNRYEKQILVPMGEYIPFEWCREWAKKYGICGSFVPGKGARLFAAPLPMGPSICYEEAFGHLMRENRVKGAEMLVNMTNDGWYPDSKLPQQHFDHARLRTVENGIPLIRSCNTGVTGAIDSLGRIVGVLGGDPYSAKEEPGAIKLNVPTYHYSTLYTLWGDYFVLALCGFSLALPLFRRR